MDRQEAVNEFLKALRIALNNASAYDKGHPYFVKTAEAFKEKIDAFFNFLNPIKIEFTPHSLFIDGKYWEKAQLYEDLASVFHLRKIQALKILQGFEISELCDFLSAMSLPVRESFRLGGVRNILAQQAVPHFLLKGLDYSQLLKEQGEECKDIWVYLFNQSIEKEDTQKINEFANNFIKITQNFKIKDLSEDEGLKHSLKGFLGYLKEKDKDKYYRCSKDLLKNILRDRGVVEKDNLQNIRDYFRDLGKEDYADVLLEQFLKEEGFNLFSFQVFSRLVDENEHKEIAQILEEKIKQAQGLKAPANSIKKMKELFSMPDPSFISIFYRNALQTLFKDDSSLKEAELDAGLKNYFYILLNLFSAETDDEKLGLICGRIIKDFDRIIETKDVENLKVLTDVLSKKKREAQAPIGALDELDKHISILIEEWAFLGEGFSDFESFVDSIEKSSLGFDFYKNKIFNEGKTNPSILRLLLKLFPANMPFIYEELRRRHSDMDFLVGFINSLASSNFPESPGILKNIYGFSNNLVKLEVLKSMRFFTHVDENLLFSVLETDDTLLKKEALTILKKDKAILKKALDKLLVIKSPFGRKNNLILENLSLIEEAGLAEAREYLVNISLKPFFWNRNIRKKAKEVLQNI